MKRFTKEEVQKAAGTLDFRSLRDVDGGSYTIVEEKPQPDFYSRVVARVRDIPIEKVTPAMRALAKNACFAAVYRTAPTRTESELFEECCGTVSAINWQDE
jgi:hypothetical protein